MGQQPNRVPNRVNVTLEPELYRDLEDWSDQQKRTMASLAAYLLHKAVESAKQAGEYRPTVLKDSEALNLYVKALAAGEQVDERTLEIVAEATGTETGKLKKALESDPPPC